MTLRCDQCSYVTEDESEQHCPDDFSPLVTMRGSGLRLEFQDGTAVEIAPGKEVALGRDPGWSDHAGWLTRFARVSRKHATVGLRVSGTAYVVPHEESTNETAVDGTPVERGASRVLPDGCTLRLSTQLSARVHIDLPR